MCFVVDQVVSCALVRCGMSRLVHDAHPIGDKRTRTDPQAAVLKREHRYPGNDNNDDREIATIVGYIHEESVDLSAHP